MQNSSTRKPTKFFQIFRQNCHNKNMKNMREKRKTSQKGTEKSPAQAYRENYLNSRTAFKTLSLSSGKIYLLSSYAYLL